MKMPKLKQPKKTLAGEVRGHKVYVQQYGLIQAHSIPSVKDDPIEHDRLLEIYLESRFS